VLAVIFKKKERFMENIELSIVSFERHERSELRERALADTVDIYVKIRHALDAVKTYKAELEKYHVFLQTVVVPEALQEEKIDKATVGGVKVRLQGDMYVSVPSDNKAQYLEWLKENGHGGMIQETVAPSTTKAFVKEMRNDNMDVPFVKVEDYVKAVLTVPKNR